MSEPFPTSTPLARDYPPAPWTMWSSVVFASFAVRAKAVASLVPPPLELMRMPGGLALAYLAVGRHDPPSTIESSELLAGVLVRHASRLAPAPHVLYNGVDNRRSQRGGYALWHLPRQLWQFEWHTGTIEHQVHIWDGTRLVCSISKIPIKTRLLPVSFRTTLLNVIEEGEVALIVADLKVRIARAAWQFQPGPDGPLAAFKPVGPMISSIVKGYAQLEPLQPLETR